MVYSPVREYNILTGFLACSGDQIGNRAFLSFQHPRCCPQTVPLSARESPSHLVLPSSGPQRSRLHSHPSLRQADGVPPLLRFLPKRLPPMNI
jgi:hypothetical protein